VELLLSDYAHGLSKLIHRPGRAVWKDLSQLRGCVSGRFLLYIILFPVLMQRQKNCGIGVKNRHRFQIFISRMFSILPARFPLRSNRHHHLFWVVCVRYDNVHNDTHAHVNSSVYQAKRLAGKNVTEIIKPILCRVGRKTVNSINQSSQLSNYYGHVLQHRRQFGKSLIFIRSEEKISVSRLYKLYHIKSNQFIINKRTDRPLTLCMK